jgi:hypothetical protein
MMRLGIRLARLLVLALGLVLGLAMVAIVLLTVGHVAEAERMLVWMEWAR